MLIETAGDTPLLPGDLVSSIRFEEENAEVMSKGGEPSTARETLLGVTKAALVTDSWLSAASFQETTQVLTDAALQGKVDHLIGLKENVIVGRLIPVRESFMEDEALEAEAALEESIKVVKELEEKVEESKKEKTDEASLSPEVSV